MTDKTSEDTKSFGGELWDFIVSLVQILLVVLVVRSLIFMLVLIPSGSMIPTLLVGDYLYVTKYAYGYSKHSVPFSAIPFSGRIFGVEPTLGDIIVFKAADKKTDFIKRLVGLPGDLIQMKNGVLFINNKAVSKKPVTNFSELDIYGNVTITEQFVETLPNGVKYNSLDAGITELDNTNVFEIPKGYYFMMGDNRDSSSDSRLQTLVKMVAFEDIIGRADFVILSFENQGSFYQFWKWPQTLRTDRMFQSLEKIIE